MCLLGLIKISVSSEASDILCSQLFTFYRARNQSLLYANCYFIIIYVYCNYKKLNSSTFNISSQ